MSLLQGRWIVPAVAAAAALGVPVWLLQSQSPEVEAPPPLVVTELALAPVGGLDQARTAPIFSPTRAPPNPGGEATAATADEAAPPAPMPVLVGLVSRARGRGVALVKGSDGQTVTIAPGESVDGWRLVGIGRDRAAFVSNGERRVAALDFSNKRPAGEAPAPVPPPLAVPPAGQPARVLGQPPLPAWPEPWLSNQSGTFR
jgi:hypothetical protein